MIDIALPVHNEDKVLADSVRHLHSFLSNDFPFPWRITIVDNASTDSTMVAASALASQLPNVAALHLEQKGRGRALRAAWARSDADVVAYMDIDLSTGLAALLPLVAPLVSGHSDVAIGSRLTRASAVQRGAKREFISRVYNALLRLVFTTTFRDAQCGFKAVRREAAEILVPAVEDEGWFFDTELLLLADHSGMRIHEVPVDWIDDPDTRVKLASTIRTDLAGVWRMARTFAGGGGRLAVPWADARRRVDDLGRQLVTFATIGTISTAVSLVLFVLLRHSIGSGWANLVALTATTIANAWANRRFTFRRRDHADRARQLASTIALYLVTAVASSLVLVAVRGVAWREVLAIAATWTVATVARFAVLRAWVFRSH